MKQKILLFFFSIFFSFFLSAKDKKSQLRIGILNGPTCIPVSFLMEEQQIIGTKNVSYEKFSDPQALLPKMIKKEIEIGFMPLNVAAKVYNSGNKAIVCCAITGLGNIKLITTDKNVNSFLDLKGKNVYVSGQGATPEYIFRFLLNKNQLTFDTNSLSKDVIVDFSIPTAQIVTQLISGKIKYAVVPEPFVTIAKMKSSSIYSVLDFQDEYQKITGSQNIYPLSVMVVRADFAKNNPELVDEFISKYKSAYEKTVLTPSEAAKLSEKYDLGLSAQVVEKAIPVSNYTFIPASKAVEISEELLEIFLKNDSSSIGGKLPDLDFYYDSKEDR